MKNKKLLDKLPTIPQYFKQYVNPEVDLEATPYQPCPFHGEKSGKSFSYSATLGIWRCFGACHTGGDVIDLHRIHYGFKSKKEACTSLCNMCGVELELEAPSFVLETPEINEKEVYSRRLYALSLQLAKGPEDWIELDYIMSKVPYDVKELEVFCATRGHVVSQQITNSKEV